MSEYPIIDRVLHMYHTILSEYEYLVLIER